MPDLSVIPFHQVSLQKVQVTRANAPSWGRALASAGLAGNHQGMPCTIGLLIIHNNNDKYITYK